MIYKSLIFLHLSTIHQESVQKNFSQILSSSFFFPQAKLTKTLNSIQSIQLLSYQYSCIMRRIKFDNCKRYIDIHQHKRREHLQWFNMHQPKQYILNETFKWSICKSSVLNQVSKKKLKMSFSVTERQLSAKKKKKKTRRGRMNEQLSIKGYSSHRSKQKCVRGMVLNRTLSKLYPGII